MTLAPRRRSCLSHRRLDPGTPDEILNGRQKCVTWQERHLPAVLGDPALAVVKRQVTGPFGPWRARIWALLPSLLKRDYNEGHLISLTLFF